MGFYDIYGTVILAEGILYKVYSLPISYCMLLQLYSEADIYITVTKFSYEIMCQLNKEGIYIHETNPTAPFYITIWGAAAIYVKPHLCYTVPGLIFRYNIYIMTG